MVKLLVIKLPQLKNNALENRLESSTSDVQSLISFKIL